MDAPRFDLLAIGNAIVDIVAPADAALIARAGLVEGSMRLIGAEEALALTAAMHAPREICGGSAANSAVGVAALGGRAAFTGLAGTDRLGRLFADDLRAAGVAAHVPEDPGAPTARCLVFVGADGQRSMCTFPGAAHRLAPSHVDGALVADSAVLLLEGYLWDSQSAAAAMEHAIALARAAGRTVALTPSDIACIERRGERMRALIAQGLIDMLFVNEAELAALAAGADLAAQVPLLVVTSGADGASAFCNGETVSAPAAHVSRVVDTTGAGDLFAAGFLHAHVRRRPTDECLRLGAAAAAEILNHYGARPAGSLRHLSAA